MLNSLASQRFTQGEFEHFRQKFSSTVFANELCPDTKKALFSATFDDICLGDIYLFRYQGKGISGGFRSRGHISARPEDTFLMILPTEGAIELQQRDRCHNVAPGMLAFLATGLPSRGRCWHSDNNQYAEIVLKIPGPRLRQVVPGIDNLCALPIQASGGCGKILRVMLSLLFQNVEGISDSQARMLETALLQTIGSAVMGAKGLPSATSRHDRVRCQAMEFIYANLSDPSLTPPAIARHCGVSLRYLQGAFSAEGLSIAAALRDARLQRSYDYLRQPESAGRSILQIGLTWGFTNPGSFSRAFKQKFGISPSLARHTL
jgi:AraC family transcriptional regulator, positive regulator of tynA and feaB